MAERWRCFVAVPIGDELRSSLTTAVADWRSRPDLEGLRWTDPASWHVTLAFLGDTDPSRISEISAVLKEVASAHAPMRLPTGGLGAFPSARRARVLWYGVEDPDGTMAALATDVGRAVSVEVATPYRPHITLARARRSAVDLRSWIADSAAPAGRLSVDGLSLMRSHLGQAPVSHQRVGSFPLQAQ